MNALSMPGFALLILAAFHLNAAQGAEVQVVDSSASAAADPSASGVGLARPAVINANAATCKPVYPTEALAAKAEGDTIVQLTVNARGIVTAASTLHRSGPTPEHLLLDSTAVHTLVRCPFRPGRDELGTALGTTVVITYKWRLN